MNHLSRRRLVQSLGLGAGAALFSPFLRQVRAGGSVPRRFVLVMEGNGIYPYSFLSTQARTQIDAQATKPIADQRVFHQVYGHGTPLEVKGDALATAKCLGPLAASPGKDSLEGRAAVLLGLSSKVTGGGHSTHYGALSCARASTPATATIDTVLGGLVKQETPFDVVRLGVHENRDVRLAYGTCALGPSQPAPMIVNPTTAYNALFGSLSGSKDFRRQKLWLDFARTDATKVLEAVGTSTPERYKFERYLESIESLRTRQQKLATMEAKLLAVRPPGPGESPLYEAEGVLAWLEAQFEIATASLLGGLTNTIVLGTGTGGAFGDLFDAAIHPDLTRHELQHQVGWTGGDTSENAAEFTRRHVSLIAAMARTLAATPEAGASGSMLDHTLIVYLSDNGEQHHSKAEEWPMLLVGGDKLGFKTDGRTVVYPRVGHANHRQVSNLFNTLGHAAGDTSMNEFGLEGPLRVAKGPLSELWAPV